jgi:hypothetical protein
MPTAPGGVWPGGIARLAGGGGAWWLASPTTGFFVFQIPRGAPQERGQSPLGGVSWGQAGVEVRPGRGQMLVQMYFISR